MFFDEADRNWLPLYQSARGEEGGVTVTGGGRANSNSSGSLYSSPSNSSNMPIPSSRRSPAKFARLLPQDSDRDGGVCVHVLCVCGRAAFVWGGWGGRRRGGWLGGCGCGCCYACTHDAGASACVRVRIKMMHVCVCASRSREHIL